MPDPVDQFTAFQEQHRLVSGSLAAVASGVQAATVGGCGGVIRIFDDISGRWVELDLSSSQTGAAVRPASTAVAVSLPDVGRKRPPGRPRLGVVSREVTLLQPQWKWLDVQQGGPSAFLRRLIDDARRANSEASPLRRRQEAAYNFLLGMAVGLPGFDDAVRALFAGEMPRFRQLIAAWPADIAMHAAALAAGEPPGASAAAALDAVTAPAAPAPRSEPTPLDGLMPPALRDAALDLLAAALGTRAIDSATRLARDESAPAAVFRICVEGADYALQIEGAPSAFSDPQRQYACLKIAGEAGIGPRLIRADVESRIAITEFIESDRVGEDTGWRESQLPAIIERVQALHAAPLFPRLMPYLDCVDQLVEQARGRGILTPALCESLLVPFREIRSAYPPIPGDLVSSHNGLNPDNVLFRGQRAWFVDWQRAFAADRYVDLAGVANCYGANEDDERDILQAYCGFGHNVLQVARLQLMRQATRLFRAMVLLDSVATAAPATRLSASDLRAVRPDPPVVADGIGDLRAHGTPAGQLRFACVLLDEFQFHARQPRFAESLVFASLSVPAVV